MKLFRNTRNPILPLEFHVPDSEAHVFSDGKLYIYGSFDALPQLYCSDHYHVVSTPDMKNWTIHDTSLKAEDIPWIHDPAAPRYPGIDPSHPTPFIRRIMAEHSGSQEQPDSPSPEETETPALLYAPDAAERDGKYYLYFCLSNDQEGVAVSASPEGPFTNPIQLPCGGIDPAVFQDDDGSIYYYWGQLSSHGVKMETMTHFSRNNIVDDLVTEETHFFHEGSSMRKIGDTYYYVYADMERGKPTALGYATSSSPLGPFVYQGIIIDNDGCDPESWNNHGSIECVNSQWYVFYHRCSRGTRIHRRLCIEKIQILPDGTIPEVKMTSQGVGDPFAPGEIIYGYQACGVTGTCRIGLTGNSCASLPEEALINISSGDTAVFRYVKSADGWKGIDVSASGSGRILLLMNGKQVGEAAIENGVLIREEVCCSPGEHELLLEFADPQDLILYSFTLK